MSTNTHNHNNSLKQNPFFKMSNKSKYLFNVYNSPQFKSIYNLLPNSIHNDFKHLLNKLYLEYTEYDSYINNLNIENSRRVMSVENAKEKINYILKNVFNNTQYIDTTIVDYINYNIDKCYVISYENNINQQTFIFNFIIYDKINIKKLNNCVKAMLLILQVIINITNNKATNNNVRNNYATNNNVRNSCNINGLEINIFMTHFAKQLELNSNQVLGKNNINSGLTYPCLKTGEIYIYRKHEFFKVFIHETMHSYNVDKLLHTNYNFNSYYQSLIRTFNINKNANSYSKIGLNESITEFWTFIIHVFTYCYYNSNDFNKLIEIFERFYKREIIHSTFQVAKILHANNINYVEFLTTITKNSATLYNETSHILSYIFFKTLLIYNTHEVINSNIFNFKIKSIYLNTEQKIDIKMKSCENVFVILRNYSLTNKTINIINNGCNIYNHYNKMEKTKTIKKKHLLKTYTKKQVIKNKSNMHAKYLLTNLNFMLIDYIC